RSFGSASCTPNASPHQPASADVFASAFYDCAKRLSLEPDPRIRKRWMLNDARTYTSNQAQIRRDTPTMDTRPDLDIKDIATAAEAWRAARYAIALVGAGISVESGIPPFRGAGGLWTKHGEPPMDGYQRLLADPSKHWREMLARRNSDDEFATAIRNARPN